MRFSTNLKTSFFFALSLAIQQLPAQDRSGPFMVHKAVQGLSYGRNYHVCESRDGFLWIGTSNGLVRFDGKRYTRIVSGPNSITDNLVVDVAEATDGKIWIAGFRNGVTSYNPQTNTFRPYPRIGYSGTDMQQVNKILPLPDGQVWLGTGNMGLALYEPSIDSFLFFTPEPRLDAQGNIIRQYTVRDIAPDPQDAQALWVIIDGNIYRFDTRSRSFTLFPIRNRAALPELSFHCLAHDGKNSLWLGAWAFGINRYDIRTGLLEHLQSPDNQNGLLALDVAILPDSTLLWACALSGLFRHDPRTGTLENITPILQDENAASESLDFQAISTTPHGGVFIGVSGYLLQWHPAFNRLSRTWSPTPNALPEKAFVSQLLSAPDGKTHYLACAGPVSLIRFQDADMAPINIPVSFATPTRGLQKLAWLRPHELLALGYDGRLYGMQHGESRMSPRELPWPLNAHLLNIQADRQGHLWAMTHHYLYRLRVQDMAVTDSFSFARAPATEMYRGWALQRYLLSTDSRGRAWISSNQGLWMAEPGSQSFRRFCPALPEGRWMRHSLVKTFYIDPDDRLWIGYNGDGLQVLDLSSLQPVQAYDRLTLPAEVINDLVVTPSGKLLATTTEGLLEINRRNFSWQIYGVQDGLFKQDIDAGLFVTPSGWVFVPHYGKFNVFPEQNLATAHDTLRLHITSLRINDVEQHPIVFRDRNVSLELPHTDNNITLNFAAMHWQFPWRTHYRYRFFAEGNTARWIDLQEPSLQITALKPGRYILQLAARGAGNVPSEIREITFTIQPPFWMRAWFITLLNAGFITLLYALYRYRLRQIRKPIEVRNTISKNLHDDIGSSLSNIQILNELARRNLDNPEKARSLLDRSADDLKRISEALSDIVWNVNPRYDDLNNLFVRMKRYAADAFDGRQIEYQLEFPEDPAQLKMGMEKRRQFYLIFKECVHNVTKHAQASRASVRVAVRGHQLILTVEDNGVGFDPANISAGNGLDNMRQRAQQCRAQLEIISRPGHGARITLTMPLP